MKRIRLLIADDHALFRDGLRALFAAVDEIEIVGEVADGERAVAEAAALQPDVVLMDINMPGVNGLEATRRILSQQPGVGILMVTMLEDDGSVFAAMRAGARGYVLKGAHYDEILQAVRAVAAGQAIFGPGIAARLVDFFANLATTPQPSAPATLPELSDREQEVLRWMARGANNRAIADQLVISTKTVANHITSIFSKLQVADREQAIQRARQSGLGGSAS